MRTTNREWIKNKIAYESGSQRRIANALGIDTASFSKALKGTRRLSVEDLIKLANYLCCSRDEVLYGFGYIDKPDSVVEQTTVAKKLTITVELK